MQDAYDIIQYLLMSIPGAKVVSGQKQILCRCPICMDSNNMSSAHFYIGPLKDHTKPLQYHCKKCDSSGIFNTKALQMFGIYDVELATILSNYNKETMSSSYWERQSKLEGIIHHVNNNQYTNNGDLIEPKIKYINQRLGLNLNHNDMIENKIVLNLYDLLESSNIKYFTRSTDIMEQLNRYFIGFLSYDNGYLNMRRLCKEGKLLSSIDKRYINYNIFNTIDNSMRFYIIPTKIDLYDINPIDVWIAEGPFDALSIKYNISTNPRSIYISAGGKGYLAVIRFLIENLGLTNLNIHLCPDADVKDSSMYYIARYIQSFNFNIYMHRNTYPGEKDFGVPKDRIIDSTQLIMKRIFI